MKRMALAFLCLLLISCYWMIPDDYDPIYSEILPIGATKPQDIGKWLSLNIRYVKDTIHDKTEYWQSPDQTYQWRSGDCEDYAILMMYMVRRELGGLPEMVIGEIPGGYHAWVGYAGVSYEAQGGWVVPTTYQEIERISYQEALWRSEHRHKEISN